MTSTDEYWRKLTNIVVNWRILTSIDVNWRTLTSTDEYWRQLTSIDVNWRKLILTQASIFVDFRQFSSIKFFKILKFLKTSKNVKNRQKTSETSYNIKIRHYWRVKSFDVNWRQWRRQNDDWRHVDVRQLTSKNVNWRQLLHDVTITIEHINSYLQMFRSYQDI